MELEASPHKYLRDFLKRNKPEKSFEQRLQRIREGHYAIFGQVQGNRYVMDVENVEEISSYVQIVDDCISKYFTTFALSKRSRFTQLLNKYISRLVQSGIVKHWLNDIIRKLNRTYMYRYFNSHNEHVDPTPLTMFSLSAMFFILVVGWVIASMVFLIEVLQSRYNFVCI